MAKKPHFYFLSDQYFIDFPDQNLMKNHPPVNGNRHDRPYFFTFQDNKNPDIYWMVPVSSKDKKYANIMQKKIAKYKTCDTIRIDKLFSKDHAFLIQNMCPATSKYLIPYIDKKNKPVRIDDRTAASITKNAQDVLKKAKHGIKLIFPDVFKIYSELEKQLQQTHQES